MNTKCLILGLSAIILAGCSSDETAAPAKSDAGSGGGSTGGKTSTGGSQSTGGSSTGGSNSTGGASGASNDAGDAGPITFTGTVVEGVPGTIGNEAGLAGVSLCVVDSKGAKVTSFPCATTDSTGAYSMTFARNQQLIVEFSKAGYGTQLAVLDVAAADIARTPFRLVKVVSDAGADGGGITNFGWDPSVVLDAKNGTLNVFAVQAAKADGGTGGLGIDFTTGVSFTIAPATGDGPFYLDTSEAYVSGATATNGGYGAWFLNLPPATYTFSATSATLTCTAIAGGAYGWAQKDGTLKAPVIAGLNTQAVGFFCAPKATDAGTD